MFLPTHRRLPSHEAIDRMQEGPLTWVPSFFTQQEYTLMTEGDAMNLIRLPLGYCRRNPKLHCESDIKCFLCERFYLTPNHLPRLYEMREGFDRNDLTLKSSVITSWIERLERLDAGDGVSSMANGNPPVAPHGIDGFVPLSSLTRSERSQENRPLVEAPDESVGVLGATGP